jgi:hypothetical protein
MKNNTSAFYQTYVDAPLVEIGEWHPNFCVLSCPLGIEYLAIIPFLNSHNHLFHIFYPKILFIGDHLIDAPIDYKDEY